MRNFDNSKRIAIKIGTATLTKDGGVDSNYVRQFAKQVSQLVKDGRQVLLVSSGAIGMGAGQLDIEGAVKGVELRQACAAVGQPLLMQEYRQAFKRYGVTIAQVLVTAEVLSNRKTYLNLRNSVETLLNLGVVPVFNENDSVSTDEIGTAFGDNDTLSALIASKVDADLLIMLTDIDGLYTMDPRKHKDAQPVRVVFEIDDKIMQSAGKSGSKHATGGMKTKIEAAKIAANAGCRIVLASGREKDVITRIVAGQDIGTLFMPRRKLGNRKRWILNSKSEGTIQIDAGAMKAIRDKKSLLPSGIVKVDGSFAVGAVVDINDEAKGVCNFSSAELAGIAGKHSSEIRNILGKNRRDVVILPEDMVFLDY